jgi:hypothetical protein
MIDYHEAVREMHQGRVVKGLGNHIPCESLLH